MITSNNSISTFLFDLDGTLLDTIELIVFSYRYTLERHRGHVPPDKVFLDRLGTPLDTMFLEFTRDAAEIRAMVDTYRAHNEEHHDGMVSAYAGAREAVQALADAGKRLGIVTSKTHAPTRRGLDLCGFDGVFETIVAAEDVEHSKPHPEPVLTALERLGARADETVFIGDSPFDLESGRRAGVRTGAACWGPFERSELAKQEPDFWLEAPGEIAGLGE